MGLLRGEGMSDCIHGKKSDSCVDCYKFWLDRSEERVKSVIIGMGGKIGSLEADNKSLKMDLGLCKIALQQKNFILESCEGALSKREADNKVLTAKVKELDWYRIQWESQVKKIKSELTTNRGEE